MKVIFTTLICFIGISAYAQDNSYTWNEAKAQEEIYLRAVDKAKAMQACCGDYFFTDAPICLENLAEDFVHTTLQKYPAGLTEEVIEEKGSIITKYIFIANGKLKILEKRTFEWGGELYYKNHMCPITADKFIEELASLKTLNKTYF